MFETLRVDADKKRERNKNIANDHINGLLVKDVANKYLLPIRTIKIIIKKMPVKINEQEGSNNGAR